MGQSADRGQGVFFGNLADKSINSPLKKIEGYLLPEPS